MYITFWGEKPSLDMPYFVTGKTDGRMEDSHTIVKIDTARILIVEDEPTIAYDIALNLESHGFNIATVCYTAEKGLDYLKNNRVELVMLDINLSGSMTGIDLARIIDDQYGIPFIFLTSHSDDLTINKAAATFPSGYLIKPFRERDLAPMVKMALMQKFGMKKTRMPSLSKINHNLLNKITPAEYNIICEIWTGSKNTEIAEQLKISLNTVKSHFSNIYSKLQLRSKADLVHFIQEIK